MNDLVTIIDSTDIKTFQGTMKKIEQFQQLVRKNLKEGKDYGTIPGTPKPSLWKPGAEKIVILGKLRSTFEVLDETKDWENEFFQFEIRWNLWSGENLICQGVGLCSSKEDKYRYRWLTEKKLPSNVNKSNLVYKEKNGQYGKYRVYRVENEDVCSIANTILKMAKKRALIDAALLVGSLSDLFTQDIEDLPEDIVSQTETIVKEAKLDEEISDEDLPQDEDIPDEEGGQEVWQEPDFKPASEKQLNFIYGVGKKKGIIHSHLLTQEEIDRIGKSENMDIEKASKILAWWWGNKEKNIIGEQEKREKNEKANPKEGKNDLERRGELMTEVLDLMEENHIKPAERQSMYKKYQKDEIIKLAYEELEELKELLEHYTPNWK